MTCNELPRCGLSNKLMASLGAALILVLSGTGGLAWTCRENAMIVFDASGSMGGRRDGFRKIDLARRALADVLPQITRSRPTGLVTYGGMAGVACNSVAVRQEPKAGSGGTIIAKLETIQPIGATSLTDSITIAADVLRRYSAPGIVVVITDGLENCGGNVCKLARRLRVRGHKVRVHVIGFLLQGEQTATLNCLAGTTHGTYVATNSLEGLKRALRRLLSCPQISGLSAPPLKF
jgi:Ca-activated chloride channel family protein